MECDDFIWVIVFFICMLFENVGVGCNVLYFVGFDCGIRWYVILCLRCSLVCIMIVFLLGIVLGYVNWIVYVF